MGEDATFLPDFLLAQNRESRMIREISTGGVWPPGSYFDDEACPGPFGPIISRKKSKSVSRWPGLIGLFEGAWGVSLAVPTDRLRRV